MGGHEKCVVILVSHGANINDRSENYPTPILPPLHLAVAHNHERLVNEMMKLGAKTDLPDIKGRTPLHIASWAGNEPLIAYFLAHHPALLNQTDERGNLPLHFARNPRIMKALISHGCKVNTLNQNKYKLTFI